MSVLLENENYKVEVLEPSVELEDGSVFNYKVINVSTGKTEFRGAALPQVMDVAEQLNTMLLAQSPDAEQLELDLAGVTRIN